uniref:Uncharacterized protein n=1 Tax=Mustela putorius furo TaxID=9669 RepID=M3YAH0_MUSPF
MGEERGLRRPHPARLLSTKRTGRRRPFPLPASGTGRAAGAEPAPAKPGSESPRSCAAQPRGLAAGASPRSLRRCEPRGTGAPRARPAGSPRSRLLAPPPPGSHRADKGALCKLCVRARGFCPHPGQGRGGRVRAWGARGLTTHRGSHRGNPTLFSRSRFQRRVTARPGEPLPGPAAPRRGSPEETASRRASRRSREKRNSFLPVACHCDASYFSL